MGRGGAPQDGRPPGHAAPVDPDAHSADPARVERYAGIFDALAPAVVFETPEGLTLVDGYDLVAAARRL